MAAGGGLGFFLAHLKAQAGLGHLQALHAAATTELEETRRTLKQAEEEREKATLDAALARQQAAHAESRVKDWEEQQEEAIRAARAAVMAAGGDVTKQLLELHQQQAAESRKQTEEQTQKTTTALFEQFQAVSQSVAVLQTTDRDTRTRLETIWQALSSPGGAGHFAEIGLENTLKTFGLTPGQDFMLQQSMPEKPGGSLRRPDAVVFLPGETLLILDAKASKFLLELARAEDAEQEAILLTALKKRMREHLRQLAGRDYRSAAESYYSEAGGSGPIRQILSVMYLPNEAALEKIGQADPEFSRLCHEHGIIPSGPTGLAGLLSFARTQRDAERQAENHERIVAAVRELLERLGVVVGHADEIGKHLRKAAQSHGDMAKSINSRLLPGAVRLEKLGVTPAKNKTLPGPVARLHVSLEDARPVLEPAPPSDPALEPRALPAAEKRAEEA